MPQRTKKDHKCSHHTEGSRWHNFHFSGKVIVCSVLLGLMLVLIGGILMAIGMDREDDTKSGNYNDVQKKPPSIFVGPVVMGIGGFAVIVGVVMCLFETQVCRKRNGDANPLITGEGVETESKDSDPTAVPSTSRDKHRNRTRKKSPSPRRYKASSKTPTKDKNQMEASLSSSQSSFSPGANSSKNVLTTSDKFLTPPDSFPHESENQGAASLMQSFTSSGKSWNVSTDFQTPAASFKDNPMSLQFTDMKDELSLNTPTKNAVENENHKFLTPKNSDAEKETSTNNNVQKQENAKDKVLHQKINTSSNPNQLKSLQVDHPTAPQRNILDKGFSESAPSSEIVTSVENPKLVAKENESAANNEDTSTVSCQESHIKAQGGGAGKLSMEEDTSDINESKPKTTKVESEEISAASNNENNGETT